MALLVNGKSKPEPKLNASFAKIVYKAMERRLRSDTWATGWLSNSSVDPIRQAIAAGALTGMSTGDQVYNQKAITKWLNSMSETQLYDFGGMLKKIEFDISNLSYAARLRREQAAERERENERVDHRGRYGF